MSDQTDKEKMWKRLNEPPVRTRRVLSFNSDGTTMTVNGMMYKLSTPFDSASATLFAITG